MTTEKTYLELTFTTVGGVDYKLNVEKPKEPVNPTDVQAAMNDIIAANIFENGGGNLNGIKGARIVTRTSTDVVLP